MKHALALLVVLVLASFVLAEQPSTEPLPETLNFDQVFQKNDRVLFVGDELTQQMFYTRGIGTAVLALRPGQDIRFINGGYEGATSGSALEWIDDLMGLAKPTVVFICLGSNDIKVGGDIAAITQSFETNLEKLIGRIRASNTVRQIIILSPPAVERSRDSAQRWSDDNLALAELSKAAFRVAGRTKSSYIELLSHLRQVYVDARQTEGEELTRAGMPSEVAHVVIASLVLRGVGVTPKMLESVGWSPLPPLRMRRVRQALAISVKPPPLEAAEKSRKLYESFGEFDERFFRLWRLAPKHPSLPPREKLQAAVDESWAKVEEAASAYR